MRKSESAFAAGVDKLPSGVNFPCLATVFTPTAARSLTTSSWSGSFNCSLKTLSACGSPLRLSTIIAMVRECRLPFHRGLKLLISSPT